MIGFFLWESLIFHVSQPDPQDVPMISPSDVPRTSPKDPIWSFRDVLIWSPGDVLNKRPKLRFKGRPWEGNLGRSQDVLWIFPREPSKHVLGTIWGHQMDVPKCLFTFLSEVIWLDVFKTSFRRLQDVVNRTSLKRPKSDVFKTTEIRRLQDVVNRTSSRCRNSDVFKTS